MLLVSDCCGAPMEEDDMICPVCGDECFPIHAMEDIDEEPEEDDEREQMIEDRGIDADNFSLKNMPM